MKPFSIISSLCCTLALFPACSSASRNTFAVDVAQYSDTEKIIYYASLAASAHNTQPWKVIIAADGIVEVYPDFSRSLDVVDPAKRELHMSLGAFIENFHLAAGSLGYHSEIKITADGTGKNPAAIISIARATPTGYPLTALEQRCIMRTPFDTRGIAPEHLETLLAGFTGNVSYHPLNSDTGTKIEKMTIAAYTQQARAAAAQQELVRWVRFSNSDVSRHRDGLTTSGMGITGFGGFFVRTFFKPEDSAGETFVETGITKTIEQARNAGGWLIIHQNAETPANWIATGRIFEQINLRCRDLGIGFHPMSQIMEEEPWRSEAAKELCPAGRHIQFIARVGYVEEYHNPVSVRRDIADFIVRR